MTTATMTLTKFLLARITEDEAMWTPAAPLVRPFPIASSDASGADVASITVDPARVLAECEAKRRIVALHTGTEWGSVAIASDPMRSPVAMCDHCRDQRWPCPTIHALAAVYADHPDYRTDW